MLLFHDYYYIFIPSFLQEVKNSINCSLLPVLSLWRSLGWKTIASPRSPYKLPVKVGNYLRTCVAMWRLRKWRGEKKENTPLFCFSIFLMEYWRGETAMNFLLLAWIKCYLRWSFNHSSIVWKHLLRRSPTLYVGVYHRHMQCIYNNMFIV